jgi:hypothetical protein
VSFPKPVAWAYATFQMAIALALAYGCSRLFAWQWDVPWSIGVWALALAGGEIMNRTVREYQTDHRPPQRPTDDEGTQKCSPPTST